MGKILKSLGKLLTGERFEAYMVFTAVLLDLSLGLFLCPPAFEIPTIEQLEESERAGMTMGKPARK